MNTQAQALLDRTEQLNPDNLPSRAGSYNGAEIFTMKVGPTWVQGNVTDMLTYLSNNVSVDLAQLADSVNQANIAVSQAQTYATSASTSSGTATTEATTATNAANNAAGSATVAQAWASQETGVVQGTSLYSARYYSTQSQYWAGISQATAASPTTFDPAYKASSISLSSDNLTATFTSGQSVILGTVGYATGQHYFEITFTSGKTSGNSSIGIAPNTEPLDSQIGYDDSNGAVGAFQTSGNVYIMGSEVGSVTSFDTAGDVMGVAVDSDRKLIWFRVNGGEWNASSTADPATATGGIAYTLEGAIYPALCTDSSAVFTGNFSGNFKANIPAGFKSWAADAYHYVVPYATTTTPGIVKTGAGVTVDTQGTLSVDTYYDISTIQAQETITIDLTTPVPGYHVVLNSAAATFSFANLSLPTGKALRLTFYFEQGTGNNTIGTWDSSIKWVGATPVFAFTAGARNVIEFETIDGVTFAGYYVGQIN
ncbi:SPRY domain-containing protein [Paraburkholderia sp. SIMBA_027]|uniref:SPRY domain-containing protein n=1 Tax=Paraburkholderia sp. SIMBA_027 TaxID=3085770 RepID=UPI00397DA00F